MPGMNEPKPNSRFYAKLVLDDVRSSPDLAQIIPRSESWIRHVRTGRLYPELERPAEGEEPWNARNRILTDEEVYRVCEDPRPASVVAAEYGVSESHIQKLRRGEHRPDAPRPEKPHHHPQGTAGHADRWPTKAPRHHRNGGGAG